MAEISLAVKIEHLKFRLSLLKQERERLKIVVETKRAERDKSLAAGDEVNSSLLDNYHSLAKDKQKLESWCQSFQESRDCNKRTGEVLKSRRHQLIGQLEEIFPLQYTDTPQPTICHVMVPSSDLMKVMIMMIMMMIMMMMILMMIMMMMTWMNSPPPESPEQESLPSSTPAHTWLDSTNQVF